MNSFFGRLDQLDPLSIMGISFLSFVLFYLVVNRKVIIILFISITCASFSGFALTQVDVVVTLIRWVCIGFLFIWGVLHVKSRRHSFGLISFWIYILLGFVFILLALNLKWQIQKTGLIVMTAIGIPLTLIAIIKDLKRIKRIFLGIAWASIPFSLMSLFYISMSIQTASRYSAFITSSSNFALIIGYISPIMFWAIFNIKRKFARVVMFISFIVCLIMLILSAQRTGTLAGLVGILTILLQKFQKGIGKTLVICCAIIFPLFLTYQNISQDKINFLINRYSNGSLSERDIIWQTAYEAIQENPYIGHGFGAAEQVVSSSFHNAFLDAWFNTGVLGLFAFAFSQLYLVIISMKLIKKVKTDEFKDIPYLMLGFALDYILTNFFESYGAGASNLGVVLFIVFLTTATIMKNILKSNIPIRFEPIKKCNQNLI